MEPCQGVGGTEDPKTEIKEFVRKENVHNMGRGIRGILSTVFVCLCMSTYAQVYVFELFNHTELE